MPAGQSTGQEISGRLVKSAAMKSAFTFPLVTVLLMLATPVFAQAPLSPPKAQPSSSPPLTLAAALATATAPTNGVVLAVQAENVQIAPNESFLEPHASITQVGDAYGRMVRRFGNVTAVAPPTMTVLNSHPGQPNIYADLQPGETAKLLAGSLSQSQWQALTSDHGLGLSDLADDNQRQLFMALFPDGKLKIAIEGDASSEPQDLSQELPQARLRLMEKTMIFLPLQGNSNMSVSGNIPTQPGQPKTYNIARDYTVKATEFSVPVRAEQTNALKPSDLDYAFGALHVPVTLTGLKTVGDLVSRIAQQTHLELYVDPRYASQSVILVGSLSSAYASDLLRALSLCLTGTWRQVGPAFVLTFDETGLGTTRQIWLNFEQQAQNLKQGPMGEAGDKIVTLHSPQDLNAFGDALTVTPEQRANWKKQNPNNFPQGTVYMNFALSEMTSAQQANVHAMNDEMTQHPSDYGHGPQLPDISGKIGVESIPTLQLLLPSLDGPVTMDQIYNLFQPSDKLQQEMWKKQQAAQPETTTPAKPSPPPVLAQAMTGIPRRAVFASPKTSADLTAIVGTMKTFGFNQLWITVFSEGQSHPDLLVAALKATKGSGIVVFPVMNLLRWGLDAPAEAQDLTILGATSAQMEQESQQEQIALNIAAGLPPPSKKPATSLLVTPVLAQVGKTLADLVHFYGTHPGIGGIVWADTASVGYTNSQNVPYRQQALGYTLSARLGFLRQYHADPIDLGAGIQADTSVSNFGDYQADDKLGKQWQQYLSAADHTLLKHLYAAAGGSAVPPHILMANQNQDFGNQWYGSWDGPNSLVPIYHGWNDETNGQQPAQPVVQAKSESKVALAALSVEQASTPGSLASQLTYLFKTDRWDGFVMEVGDGKEFANFGSHKATPPVPQNAK